MTLENYQEDEIRTTVKNIAEKNGFSATAKITFNGGDEKFAGYMGEMVIICVEDEKTKRTLNMIAKISIKDEKPRDYAPIKEAYENEILAYETILPALERLQSTANIPKPFNSIANLHVALREEEYLIFENLRISGFEMLQPKEMLDADHVKFIFKCCAEIHALSFALKVFEPEKFHKISSDLKNLWSVCFVEKNDGQIMSKLVKSIDIFMRENDIENQHFNRIVNDFEGEMEKIINYEKAEYSCFVHGDCWSNNFMFKYKTENGQKELEQMKILDWQYCNVGPPVQDLTFILFSGGSKEILDNYETYLSIYHEALAESLAYFNLDVDKIYPFQEMKRQWKQYYFLSAIRGSLVWKLRSIDEKDVTDTMNINSNDDFTYFDAALQTRGDVEYLVNHLKILWGHIDEVKNGII